ncbi:ABC transporter ATP-binding protein [Granulicella sp. WH15]|uniref:ABC transporter ATP-binding protein n=1 Tax=Granulicella sp. WH15 TaxID=2602070 RepID=UPI0021056D81|nr:ABC transporter ATP-binding protein [Granulicella sp. WH15]
MPSDSFMTDAVHLQQVRFSYTRQQPILRIDELCISSGHRCFLHGPSGSGKTTLLSLISGVLKPQQGSIRILGQELTQLSAAARDTLRGSQIGYIFQGFNLIPYLSVEENIALPCKLHPERRARITAETLSAEVTRLASRLDIHTHLSAPVAHLSVGQQQRVAIARAIIGSPALVIADEPTSALDTDRREDFLSLLTEVTGEAKARGNPEMTLLFVSHDRSLATRFDSILSLPEINQETRSLENTL